MMNSNYCTFSDFSPAFPRAVAQDKIIAMSRRGTFPASVRVAGRKDEALFRREAVIAWFHAKFSEVAPDAVTEVEKLLGQPKLAQKGARRGN